MLKTHKANSLEDAIGLMKLRKNQQQEMESYGKKTSYIIQNLNKEIQLEQVKNLQQQEEHVEEEKEGE